MHFPNGSAAASRIERWLAEQVCVGRDHLGQGSLRHCANYTVSSAAEGLYFPRRLPPTPAMSRPSTAGKKVVLREGFADPDFGVQGLSRWREYATDKLAGSGIWTGNVNLRKGCSGSFNE